MLHDHFSQNIISPLECLIETEIQKSKYPDSPWLEKNRAQEEGELYRRVSQFLEPKLGTFSISFKEDFQYPRKLHEIPSAPNMLYYKGDIDLTQNKCVSVVGARQSTIEGEKRTKKIVELLVKNKITIVSGLARGIDTVALSHAIKLDGDVIAVIGTPIDQYYPKENKGLQDIIAKNHLLISQVPFYRYAHESFKSKRFYFPQRNILMSSLSEATIIIEASNTSGTLTQARAALKQKRQLFILNSCFEKKELTWPKNFLKQGAIRVQNDQDLLSNLV